MRLAVAGLYEARHPEVAQATRAQEPRSYLYFGFTTLVDLGGRAHRIARWNEADIRPDAHFCGWAAIPNSYGTVQIPQPLRRFVSLVPSFLRPSRLFGFDDSPYLLYDERQRPQIPRDIDPARHTPQAVVARMASDGAICVKSAYETGFGGVSGLPTPTVEIIRDVVTAAHARNMRLLLHANSLEAHAFAVSAGVDIAAHGIWNGLPDDDGLNDEVRELLRAIVAGDIGFQPTLQVLHGLLDLLDDEFLDDPMLEHALPPGLIAWYRTEEGQWFRNEVAAGLSGSNLDAQLRRLEETVLAHRDKILAQLAADDARLLFGTDTPSAPTYANPPGLNGLLEMRGWIAAGVSEAQLFRALTLANAESLGLAQDIGSVEAGRSRTCFFCGRTRSQTSMPTIPLKPSLLPDARSLAKSCPLAARLD